jgi:hypothetical protein
MDIKNYSRDSLSRCLNAGSRVLQLFVRNFLRRLSLFISNRWNSGEGRLILSFVCLTFNSSVHCVWVLVKESHPVFVDHLLYRVFWLLPVHDEVEGVSLAKEVDAGKGTHGQVHKGLV